MQRLSQLSAHLVQGLNSGSVEWNATPLQADPGNPANTYTTMAKAKVVVTRQLIDEAQRLLDAKKDELEIVQWQSDKVSLYVFTNCGSDD